MQKFVENNIENCRNLYIFYKWKIWKGTMEKQKTPSMQKNLKRCKTRQKTQKVKIFVA